MRPPMLIAPRPPFLAARPIARPVDAPLPGPAPYLTQLNGHRNQAMNCVCTSLAMLAIKFNPRLLDAYGGSADLLINTISETMLAGQRSRGVDGLRSYPLLGWLGASL